MIEDVRTNYLKPPSFEPYNLKETEKKDPSKGQSKVILEALQNMVGQRNIQRMPSLGQRSKQVFVRNLT